MSEEHALLASRDISGTFMQIYTNLHGSNASEWLRIYKKVNRKENPFPETLKTSASTRGLSQGMLVAEAFVTKPGRFVYDSFKNRITPAYPNRLRRRSIKKIKHFDLTEDSYDKDIIKRAEMGGMKQLKKFAVTPDQIDSMMMAQPNGEPGNLLTNGYANIFYVEGVGGELFAVHVRWYADRREWYVYAYELGERGHWLAGRRVFRNT